MMSSRNRRIAESDSESDDGVTDHLKTDEADKTVESKPTKEELVLKRKGLYEMPSMFSIAWDALPLAPLLKLYKGKETHSLNFWAAFLCLLNVTVVLMALMHTTGNIVGGAPMTYQMWWFVTLFMWIGLSAIIAYDLARPVQFGDEYTAKGASLRSEFFVLCFIAYDSIWLTLSWICHRSSATDDWFVNSPSFTLKVVDEDGFRFDGNANQSERQYYAAICSFFGLFFYTVFFLMRNKHALNMAEFHPTIDDHRETEMETTNRNPGGGIHITRMPPSPTLRSKRGDPTDKDVLDALDEKSVSGKRASWVDRAWRDEEKQRAARNLR